MRVPLLILNERVSPKWLETCHEKVIKQLELSSSYHKSNENCCLPSHSSIENKVFTLDSYDNITGKQTLLIKVILEHYNVFGIWRELTIPDTVETIIGLDIFGFPEELKFAHNMIHFLLNGFDRYYYIHVQELRRKKLNRRAIGKKLPMEMDARKRTNQNIKVKVDKLIDIINSSTYCNLSRYKRKLILEHILEYEKLDRRAYGKPTSDITVKLVKSRKGLIQLNRII